MLVSAAVNFLLSRRHGLSRAETVTWTLLGACLSVPAVVAFLLMHPWRREALDT